MIGASPEDSASLHDDGLSRGDSSRPPLRLLYVTPFPPRLDGAHGGSRAIAQLISRVAERHRVALVTLRHPLELGIDDDLRRRLDLVEEVERPGHDRARRGRALRGARNRLHVLGGKPLWATAVDVPAFHRRLTTIVSSWKPDLLQFHYTAMGGYLRTIAPHRRPIVLWEPDPATNAASSLGHVAAGDRLLRYLDVRAWRRFEAKVLRRVDAVVVFTDRDARVLATASPATPVVQIPLGTDFVDRTFLDRVIDGTVLFVGNFVHPPNIDAARRLIARIFPRVIAAHPGASLLVVGDEAPVDVAAASNRRINVTGLVPDPVPYIECAAVVAVPIRFGGGMRVKVLEAIAAGKPLVASRLAVEGLGLVDGKHFLAAETDDDFVSQISALLADEAFRRRIGAAARRWALDHLAWDTSIAAYESLYLRLVADAPTPKPEQTPGTTLGLA